MLLRRGFQHLGRETVRPRFPVQNLEHSVRAINSGTDATVDEVGNESFEI